MREFLFNLDLKQLWEKITQLVVLLVDAVTAKLWAILEPYYHKALDNPLAAGAILLGLIAIPLILIKLTKSKSETESEGRLDQLMEEMKDFELKTPLIDLQQNYDDPPFKNLEPLHEEIPTNMDFEMDHERDKLESDSMVELPSLFSSEEPSENETSIFSEEWETANDPLSEDSIENQLQRDDRSLEREHLTEQEADWSQISLPALPEYDDTDMTIQEIENLQQEMEDSIQNLTHEVSSASEEQDSTREIKVDSVSQAPKSVEPRLQDENIEETAATAEAANRCQNTDAATQPTESLSSEPGEDRELSVPEEDHLSPAQETFDENFENQFQSTVTVPQTSVKESRRVQSPALKPAMNSQGRPNHTRIKPPGKDYRDILESFILLKDQKR